MTKVKWFAAALGMAMLAAGGAPAQTKEDVKRCTGADPDAAIAACTVLLKSGIGGPDEKADFYYFRGFAIDKKATDEGSIAGHFVALLDFNEAIKLKPNDAEYRFWRGLAELAVAKYEEALADADTAIKIKPSYSPPYNLRGAAHARLGQNDLARADYKQALKLRPDDAIARKGLTELPAK
ncbi:MAG TPA: tetratricopeptide repeat protein [Stellaceae bacterium]|nr:tetratricopeptide repeat protein [Stellaceae bacterium]